MSEILEILDEKLADLGRARIIVDYLDVDEELEAEAYNALTQLKDIVLEQKQAIMENRRYEDSSVR